MSTYVEVGISFYLKDCDACGMHFAIPSDIERRCADEKRAWWCPGCGHRWYYGLTTTEKLRKELEQKDLAIEAERRMKENARAQRDAAQRSLNSQRGATTKLKNRIKNGLCPCCRRSFTDLQRHMKTKHPKWHQEKRDD